MEPKPAAHKDVKTLFGLPIKSASAAHTPTPWTYETRQLNGWGITGLWGGTKQILGSEAGWDSNGLLPSNEDAAFIVRACNAHEELVGLLKELIMCGPDHLVGSYGMRVQRAIVKAEGGV